MSAATHLNRKASRFTCQLIASGVVFSSLGCAADAWTFTDLRPAGLVLDVEGIGGNQDGLRYGLRGRQEGGFENDLFVMHISYLGGGYFLEIENRTEYAIRVNWTECLLVDFEGWTHNVIHPDALGRDDVWRNTEVLIAPAAKRLVPLVAWTARERQLNRPAFNRPFHPRKTALPTGRFTERVVLSLGYRDKKLVYDLALRISLREKGTS